LQTAPGWRRLLRGILILGSLLIALLAVIALVRFKIDLSPQRETVAALLSETLGRPVAIDGPIGLATSLWPAISVHGVRIGNPPGFDNGDFASLELARLEIGLLPLAFGNVHVRDITLTGLTVNLRENQARQVNWALRPGETPKSEPNPTAGGDDDPQTYQLTGASLMLDDLIVERVTVTYQDPEMDAPHEFELTRLTGSARQGEPLALDFDGHLLRQSFTGHVELASLKEFLLESRTWIELQLTIAETDLAMSGALDVTTAVPSARLDLSIAGASLDSLNSLTGLDLPPFRDYRGATRMSHQEQRLTLDDFSLRVGSSELKGSVIIGEEATRKRLLAQFTAPRLQLADFALGTWSAEPEQGTGSPDDSTAPPASQVDTPAPRDGATTAKTDDTPPERRQELAELMSPEFLKTLDLHFELDVGQVLDGDQPLGSGRLVATLESGRITLDPLTLGLPGGAFNLALSLKPGHEATDASLRAYVDNFDFGLIVKRADPESDMGGRFSLDVDLKTRASSVSELFENANGHIDLAATPVNLQAGIVDLWAVNLLSAIATNSSKEPSRINCIISQLTLRDGILIPETFVIDTSKIRICGKGEADFKARELAFNIAPRAKKPEFFSLATPFKMHGSFTDFSMGIDLPGLVGTSISFITSPLHVPLRRLGKTGAIPTDGSDICQVELNQATRVVQPTPGCRNSASAPPTDDAPSDRY